MATESAFPTLRIFCSEPEICHHAAAVIFKPGLSRGTQHCPGDDTHTQPFHQPNRSSCAQQIISIPGFPSFCFMGINAPWVGAKRLLGVGVFMYKGSGGSGGNNRPLVSCCSGPEPVSKGAGEASGQAPSWAQGGVAEVAAGEGGIWDISAGRAPSASRCFHLYSRVRRNFLNEKEEGKKARLETLPGKEKQLKLPAVVWCFPNLGGLGALLWLLEGSWGHAGGVMGMGRGHLPSGQEHQASLWGLGSLPGTLRCTWLARAPCTPTSRQT